jgi:hypothetical protein
MKEIQLSQGKVAIVDDKDYEYLSKFKWYASYSRSGFYAVRSNRQGQKPSHILMHRVILNAPLDKEGDHINGDTLDNRRCNLRLCSHSQNICNSRKPTDSKTSIYKGVSLPKGYKRWKACIAINGRNKHLGFFSNELDAAKAYNKAAIELFGEFARLNVIRG